MGAGEGAGVFVGDVDEAGFLGGVENGIQGGGGFGGFFVRIEFAVAVVDGDLVPDADVGGVALREAGYAVLIEGDVGVRVFHDGDGFFGGGGGADGGERVMRTEEVA